jgi:hypothetical protein
MDRSKQIFFVADLCKLSSVGNYKARIMQFFVSNKQNNAIARQFLITFIKLIIWIWMLTVKIRQPSHEFTFGVRMSFIPYPLVLTPVV